MTVSVEKTTYGETYVVQDDGSKVIPESKRPDGTIRKAIRVKEGFTPSGETRYDGPDHIAKQKAATAAAAYPTGYESSSLALGERRIPGYMPDASDGKPEAKKKSRRRKGKNANAEEGPDGADEEAAEVADAAEGGEVAEVEAVEVKQPEPEKKAEEAPKAAAPAEAPVSKYAEEEKLIRKAKKKLNDIETLEKRGPPYTPEEEAKVSRKAEFLNEIKYLEKVQKGQASTAKGKQAAAAPQKEQPKKQEPAAQQKKQESAPKPSKAEAPAAAPKSPKQAPKSPKQAPAAPAGPKMDAAEVEAAQKRLRNVKKKLTEIDNLKSSGKELSAEQMAKVERKGELDIEMSHLNKQLGL
jgi:partner of Y14 and mago protein